MSFPKLSSERLAICLPAIEQASVVSDYFRNNREFHAPWDPVRGEEFYTRTFWERRLQSNRQEFLEDRSVCFFIFLRDGAEVIGCCNFTNFIRGFFQCCNLGFSLAENAQGHGYMREALQAGIDYVFQEKKLHRIQANHLPQNLRSRNVLRKLGFVVEGYARDYLFINNAWQDHVLNSLTNQSKDFWDR